MKNTHHLEIYRKCQFNNVLNIHDIFDIFFYYKAFVNSFFKGPVYIIEMYKKVRLVIYT
jgi:hypothetical protein